MAQLKSSAEAVAMAWQFGIDKLPAVLVDYQYVVYGDFDAKNALARIEAYRHAP